MGHPALAAIRLVACGNADRGDDGLAWKAVRPLAERLPAEVAVAVEVRRATELRVEDLLDLVPGQSLVIVDAVSGVEPGTVVRFPLDELPLATGRGGAGRPAPRSSHQLPIEVVLGLAETLLERRIEGVFVGLGGGSFGIGEPLSEIVTEALPRLRAAVVAELMALARPAPQPAAAGEG